MTDTLIEIFRVIVAGLILGILLKYRNIHGVSLFDGWRYILYGFGVLFFGMVLDITDNFEQLNRFIIIGNTPIQAFLEKVIGNLFGLLLVFIGILKWIPQLLKHNQETSSELKKLSGLLPICLNCKKIRDSEGYWKKIESYIAEHSDAKFTHGLCEDCMEELYGKKEWYSKKEETSIK